MTEAYPDRMQAAVDNIGTRTVELITPEQIKQMANFNLTVYQDGPIVKTLLRQSRTNLIGPDVVTMANLADMNDFVETIEKTPKTGLPPIDGIKQGSVIHDQILSRAVVVAKLLRNEVVEPELAVSLSQSEAMYTMTDKSSIAKRLLGRLANVASKSNYVINDEHTALLIPWFDERKSYEEKVGVLDALCAFSEQFQKSQLDGFIALGVTYLSSMSKKAKKSARVSGGLKRWMDNVHEFDSSTDDYDKLQILRDTLSDVMKIVNQVVYQPKIYGREPHFEKLREMSETYSQWMAKISPKNRYIQETNDYIEMKRAFADQEPEALDNNVIDDIKTESEHYSEEQLDELRNHLADLQSGHDNLAKAWFNKAELKANGFHDITYVLNNGGEGEDWKLSPLSRDQPNVWEISGIIMRSSQLLNSLDLDSARKILYGDIDMEDALTTDIAIISNFLVNECRLAKGQEAAYKRSLDHTIEYIRANWDNLSGMLKDKWPMDSLDLAELKQLLFNEDIEQNIIDLEEQTSFIGEIVADSEIEFLPHPKLTEVARQLEWIVLPGGTLDEIRQSVSENYPPNLVNKINWNRIADLVTISEAFDGTIYRSKDRTLGNNMPYFVVECDIDGKTFAIAESPQYGNATYIVRSDIAAGEWKEVLELERREARDLGAHKVIHPKSEIADRHLSRIYDKIQDLLTLAGIR